MDFRRTYTPPIMDSWRSSRHLSAPAEFHFSPTNLGKVDEKPPSLMAPLDSQETVSCPHEILRGPADSQETVACPSDFSTQFFDKSPKATAARSIYLKTVCTGVFGLSIAIFAIFPIYWGSLWSSPRHTLPGWIVDFDGGAVGQFVSGALSAMDPGKDGVFWEVVPASRFPGGISDLENAIVQEKTWYGLTINAGASANLSAALAAADASSYNASLALTFMGNEARNELMFPIHLAFVTQQLTAVSLKFAIQFLQANISSSANVANILSKAPELAAQPISLRASAVTFVGLIYLLILSFFIVVVSNAAREAAGLNRLLTLGSLIRVRLVSSFVAYFFISLFYTLLSRAFQLPFDRRFGDAGFVIFWMLNWAGMLACGLALEAMITLLTMRFIPFFLILWIISNVSIAEYPLQVLPHIHHYGFAWPFYNISRAVRSIVFRTKNDLGLNFGIILGWVVLSCITIPLFQWFVRRRMVASMRKAERIASIPL
ncbi:DUF3533 domain-containing protein [Mycena sanguinolenta]|uniref:DUF3533 domain-containing protein n=1 Tax=Mycena sanguinolenta TaxID=230812 RepID=A0A8H6YTK3_9AGAR|nr:DUF3533 domain-containing protein [Mycena sanguinolenta]